MRPIFFLFAAFLFITSCGDFSNVSKKTLSPTSQSFSVKGEMIQRKAPMTKSKVADWNLAANTDKDFFHAVLVSYDNKMVDADTIITDGGGWIFKNIVTEPTITVTPMYSTALEGAAQYSIAIFENEIDNDSSEVYFSFDEEWSPRIRIERPNSYPANERYVARNLDQNVPLKLYKSSIAVSSLEFESKNVYHGIVGGFSNGTMEEFAEKCNNYWLAGSFIGISDRLDLPLDSEELDDLQKREKTDSHYIPDNN